MKIAVYGAGAIGSFLGGLLADRNEVTLVGRGPHVKAINRSGLKISGMLEKVVYPRAATDLSDLKEQDVVIITVKAYDTEKAKEAVSVIVGEKTTVVTIQNGLNNLHSLDKKFGDRVVGGVTSIGVTHVSPGHIRLAGKGDTVFGSLRGYHERVKAIVELFNRSGIESRYTENIIGEIWLKAIVNSSINPITAILRRKNECIVTEPELRDLARKICEEATGVAQAAGIVLPLADPFQRVMEVASSTKENYSSMLQDIERGKKTEIDEITGAIVAQARKLGIDVPVNETIWKLVRALSVK
ncbi:MAG: 2-dehydropantoate 2-reductase [Methanomassiliicoccales archaeon]|jgi:2-dehydropantoate 2-reductase|nr:2-dehydropantoate 2-reductase [Methanomassiliicoccales archaeon]